MAKLKRSAHAVYLDSTMGGNAASWFRIGVDLEELSIELNPDVEVVTNILDETSVKDNGYQPQFSADPYYANPTDAIYESLRDIALERKKGDECKTKMLEVIIEDTTETSHLAFVEDVVIKPQSYGGDTSGFQIPFMVYSNGNRTKGTVTINDGVPTFTADAD